MLQWTYKQFLPFRFWRCEVIFQLLVIFYMSVNLIPCFKNEGRALPTPNPLGDRVLATHGSILSRLRNMIANGCWTGYSDFVAGSGFSGRSTASEHS